MKVTFIIGLFLLCASCQVGRIPCPKIKTAKLHRSTVRPSSSLLTARANPVVETESVSQKSKEARPADVRYVKNVSVEEWDCPKPGAKRYMPKSVKDNIRKNKRKFEEDLKNGSTQADSLSTR
jgi:hypothetical protein